MTIDSCGERMSKNTDLKLKNIIEKGIIERLRKSYYDDLFEILQLFLSDEIDRENLICSIEKIVPFLYELRQNGRLSQTIENSQKIIVNKLLEELKK
jgi:hypothetical protein